MLKYSGKIAIALLAASSLFPNASLFAQTTKPSAVKPAPAITTEKAIDLAQQGRCKEALPTLKRVLSGTGSSDTRKQAGLVGLRCALALDDRDASVDFLR